MSPLRRLLEYSREFRGRYLLGTIYAVVNKVFDIAPEILIGVAVDVVVKRNHSFLAKLGVASLSHQLAALGVATVAIWGGESLFQYLYGVEWRNLAQALQHKARADVYDHLQHLRMSELESRRQGELQTILTEDVNQLERFLDGGLVAIIHVVTSTLLVSVVFFILSPGVAIFAMLPIPIIVLVALWFQRGLASRYAVVRASAGKLGARLTSQLHGIATIKAYTAQAQAQSALHEASSDYVAANRSAIKLSSAFVPLIRMAVLSGFVVTLVFGGFRALEGSLAVGAYSVLVFLTQRLLWPFTRLGETVDLYQRSMASANRLLDLLALEREPTAGGESVPSATFRGDIQYDAVSFAYADSNVLNAVSLDIKGGSFIGLVGSTGSGKSTFVKLLLRFYTPSVGELRIGGRPLSSLRIDELRRNIAWVSQEAFLFHGTIHENIALGSPNASRASVMAAAKAGELHDFVQTLPKGYDTLVGDFGSTLSGGQRQRLSIARAVLKDPAILILDEATSAVDNETEAAIQRSIARLSHGRTVIAVAHRLSTIRAADVIFVLEAGRIVEAGRHEELLAKRARYAHLWAMQIGHRASANASEPLETASPPSAL
jgi:ATP-binding cassette, subfamily B, bacterial